LRSHQSHTGPGGVPGVLDELDTETTHRVESMYGKFSRSFTLPADADEAGISARSKNGVLKVRIPKLVEAKDEPVRIAVE